MEWERLTTDEIEERLLAAERLIGQVREQQLRDLEELDRRQVATGDGCKSLAEWAATRLDMGLDHARELVRTMRRTGSRPDLREALASGEVSFDRVEALSRIPEDVSSHTTH